MKSNTVPGAIRPASARPHENLKPKFSARLFFATFLIILCGSLALQVLGAWQDSPTRDEPSHIDDGLAIHQLGTFEFNYPHPPLAKLLPGIAAYLQGVRIDTSGDAWARGNTKALKLPILYENRSWHELQKIVFASRLPMLLFPALLITLVWWYARRQFGDLPALIATSIIAFDPSLLGHGYLVNTDVPVTAMIFALAITLDFYFQKPTGQRLILVSFIFGLTQLTKFSAVYLWPIVFTLLLINFIRHRTTFGFRKLMFAGLSIGLITAGLFLVFYRLEGLIPNTSPFKTWQTSVLGRMVTPIPPSYWRGLQYNIRHNRAGHRTVFRQQVIQKGHPLYFPVALLTKTPIPTLALWILGIVAGVLAVVRWRQAQKFRILIFVVIPLTYAVAAIRSQLNIGIRHIFPIYPFLALLVAWSVYRLGEQSKWLRYATLALALAVIPLSLSAYPATISYFNAFAGGSANGYRWFIDSNSDWGQDAWRVGKYFETHPGGSLAVLQFSPVPTTTFALGAKPPPNNRASKKTTSFPDRIIISDAFLRAPDKKYGWLLSTDKYFLAARIGTTISVYSRI